MGATFRFLGTGASTGVPMVGCPCSVCHSDHPGNRRLRTSGLLTVGERNFLIDVGPDFRQQALLANLTRLDGLLLTHPHYDHICGIDELRVFYFVQGKPVPCLLSQTTLAVVKKTHFYIFDGDQDSPNKTAKIDFHLLPKKRGAIEFEGVPFNYFTYAHGAVEVTGYRYSDFAYISDINQYSQAIFEDLAGVRTLVVSALRFEESDVHFTIDQAISFAHEVGADRTWFIHMGHELDFATTTKYLPKGIELAYDGLTIEL